MMARLVRALAAAMLAGRYGLTAAIAELLTDPRPPAGGGPYLDRHLDPHARRPH